MHERIKSLRKCLKLTQEEFASKLGIKRAAISQVETGYNNVSEQLVITICSIYKVNESWLRTGEGKMFQNKSNSLEDILQGASEADKSIIRAYLAIDPEIRGKAINQFFASIGKSSPFNSREAATESKSGLSEENNN